MKIKIGKYTLTFIIKFEVDKPWVKEFKAFLRNGEKLNAVKLLKLNTDMGLYEAKTLYDTLQDEWTQFGYFKTPIE